MEMDWRMEMDWWRWDGLRNEVWTVEEMEMEMEMGMEMDHGDGDGPRRARGFQNAASTEDVAFAE